MEQLDMQIRLLRRRSENSKNNIFKGAEFAAWYYNPVRFTTDAFHIFKKKLFKLLKVMALFLITGLSASSCRTESVDFKYSADEFADIEVIRYRIPGWENLSFQQKEYIYHLSEAAKWGRDIIWAQNFKDNLKIRKALENVIENYDG
ncbi:MAG: hypothetical protein HUJ90_03495, partial [Bacteroidales bacterium]|nr:hypothetical protein [Bacteroidales bacterium]